MEVFVKEKNMPKSCIDCEFCITTNIKNGHTKKYEEITQCCFGEYYKLDKINTCPLKSLDQHDTEVRADERKKVIDVFSELIIECFKKYSLNGKNNSF